MNSIICPLCKKPFPPDQALIPELEEINQEKINKQLAEIEAKAQEKAKKEFELAQRDSEKEKKEKDDKIDKLMEDLLKSNQEKRELQQKDKERELEKQKWQTEEGERIAEKARKDEREKADLEKKETQIKMDSMQKKIDEMSRKGESKSQQLQGEAMEEEVLRLLKTFGGDEIIEIEKGVSGADIRQIVKSPRGYPCGTILWECKRAEWSEKKWIDKLKLDQRSENANLAVIVSTNLPKDAAEGFVNRGDDIWICSLSLVVPLAVALRKILLDAAYQRALAVNRGEKKEDLFSYITSEGFVQPVKTIVEVYKEMILQIDKERVSYEKSWKQRESQAKRVIDSMANIVGNIQGKIGASALQIKELDLLESGEPKT